MGVETFTFLFTDIEGSTAMLRRLREGRYAQVLADHRSLSRSGLSAHGGREVDTQGDGLFAVFSSPSACLAAVIDMQMALETHAWPGGEHVRVRMGIHTGEASKTATGLIGLDVHRAARVAAVGYGGQVLLSETAATLVLDSLPAEAALKDLGVHRLKDLGRPERIFQLQAPGLQAEFRPLRSLGNPALLNNLPAQLSTFIGRDRELSEVRALGESSRMVTLTGAGGCGNTRLSLQVAAEMLDGAGDGVWLVELAAVSDPDAVPSAISGALGIAPQAGRPALEALLDALGPQDILIMLDNCEHLIDACAKTADALLRRCPRVHLLATSREPLSIDGETSYRVPPLSLPGPGDGGPAAPGSSDAVTLFVERARERGVDLPVDGETAPLVVSICEQLDGMPLAIELAAARLRSLSLADLNDRLDQRFRLLTGGSRAALGRQQTLQATVDWSYSLLNGAEQTLLRRTSVFAEGFDLGAAESVCGFGDIDVLEVADLLDSLVNKSLVGAEPAGSTLRYRLLETIRQFAAERLAETGDEAAAAAAAHRQHFLEVAEAAAPYLEGPDQGMWFARLDTDHANLRRAAEHAAGDPDATEQTLRFAAAMHAYWMARARPKEELELVVPLLDRADARKDPELLGTVLAHAAISARVVDVTKARQLGERAVEFTRQLDDDRALVESLAALCGAYYFAGEPERGLALGEESVERARRLGDEGLLAGSLLGYLLCADRIEPDRTERLFAEAIACAQRSGDLLMSCFAHNNAGVHALRAGDFAGARAHLEQADAAMRATGSPGPQVSVNLGWVLHQEGDLPGALARFEAGLRVGRRLGDRSGIAYATLGLACATADLGDPRRAAELHGAAQAALERTGEPWPDPEAGYRRESLDGVRAALGEELVELVYARGMTLGLDQALDLALGRSR